MYVSPCMYPPYMHNVLHSAHILFTTPDHYVRLNVHVCTHNIVLLLYLIGYACQQGVKVLYRVIVDHSHVVLKCSCPGVKVYFPSLANSHRDTCIIIILLLGIDTPP